MGHGMPGRVRIGLSGWRYAGWRGIFYPSGLRQADELRFAAQRFDSIEINGSFYSLKSPKLYAAWRDEAPPGFVFAVKGSRYITHMLKLRNVETALANFWASGPLSLAEKLGPILWQFPPNLGFDGRFEEFFELLPRNTERAAELSQKHDARVPRAATAEGRRRLRYAVEIRHPSFVTPDFVALLRRHGIALVVADSAKRFPYVEDVTADFVYLRLHGDEQLYMSGYSPKAIRRWAEKVRAFRAGEEPPSAVLASPVRAARRARDVYVYFDNDGKVRAPFDAESLRRVLARSDGTPVQPGARSRSAGSAW
jgi:uncharacterized protein YecE (DUF72 family)